jgi:putative nucleotidyltransferase with HDIG domain
LESICLADPVMAAQVLSLANSVRFGARLEITRVKEAIQRVGVPEARRSLLGAGISALFASKALHELWAHSQRVAELAWIVAGLCGEDRGAAYTAGLLHDIGRLVFLRQAGEIQAEEWRWIDGGFPLLYAETLARGEDHAERGAALLSEWGLPSEIVDAVRLHHRPEGWRGKLPQILFLAEDLAVSDAWPAEDLWGAMRRKLSLERLGLQLTTLQGAVANFGAPELRRVC